MGTEDITAGDTLADLNPAWPLGGDDLNQGDDHLRNLKKAVQYTFMNISATVSSVAAELDLAHKGGTISGALMVKDTLTVSGAAVLKAGVTFEGEISGSLALAGSLSVSATTVLKDAVLCEATLTVSGAMVAKTTLSVEGGLDANTATFSASVIAKAGIFDADGGNKIAFPLATAANVTSETSSVVVSPSVLNSHPAAVKAWAHYNGTSAAVLQSYNVSSITDNGTGNQSLVFSSSFTAVTIATPRDIDGNVVYAFIKSAGPSGVQIQQFASGVTSADGSEVMAMCVGTFV